MSLFLLRLKSQLSQPLLTEKMLQFPNHIWGPVHDLLPSANISPILGSPELSPALLMWPHQCGREGKDHLPELAGNTSPKCSSVPIFISVQTVTEGLLVPWGTKIFQAKQVKTVTLCLYEEPCRSQCLTYSGIFQLIIPSCTWIRYGQIIPFGKLYASVKIPNTPG